MLQYFYPYRVLLSLLCLVFVFSLFFSLSRHENNLTQNIIIPSPTLYYTPALPTLPEIFSETHSTTSDSGHIRTLIATGDIIPARSVNVQTLNRSNFLWAFEKTANFLKSADITFINLETPLLKKCLPTVEGMIFCADSRHIQGLVYSGIDVASLANNHAGNYGEDGVTETVDLLIKANIEVTGLDNGEPVIKNIRGIKFAFLGYNDITTPQPGVANVDKEKIKRQIADARVKADIVIVTYHWGVEYRNQPDDRQKELGHFTIDSGADLVIGNHPHWIQPVEIYKGKLITYAHGNFVFDQMWSQKTREGVVGKYTFYDKQIIDVEYFPLQIDDFGQPHFVEGEQRKKILDEMKDESFKLSELNTKP